MPLMEYEREKRFSRLLGRCRALGSRRKSFRKLRYSPDEFIDESSVEPKESGPTQLGGACHSWPTVFKNEVAKVRGQGFLLSSETLLFNHCCATQARHPYLPDYS